MTVIASAERPPSPGPLAALTPAGFVLIFFWVLVAIGVGYGLFESIDSDRLAQYGPRILTGFVTTLRLVAVSLVIGAILSVPIAIARLSRNSVAAGLAYAYVYFFRGTPLIAQLFLIYYGAGEFAPQLKAIGAWGFFKDAFNCAALAFAINTAAYQAEILSGAIRTVPRGQREAADALGVHMRIAFRKIILPQALITALRPYGNEVVLLIKASAIASIVTVLDLMGQTRFVFSKTYDLSFYFWAAVFYLVTVEILSRGVSAMERRLTRHLHYRG